MPYTYSCTVTEFNHWGSGYTVQVTVDNTSSVTLNDWQVDIYFDDDPQITNSWNANLTSQNNTVFATNLNWNGTLQPGQTTSFGFQGNSDGNLSRPYCYVQQE